MSNGNGTTVDFSYGSSNTYSLPTGETYIDGKKQKTSKDNQ